VPVFEPDFDCGDPLFGGEGNWETSRLDPAGEFVKVIADRAERPVESTIAKANPSYGETKTINL
jgi:hypothetical protein